MNTIISNHQADYDKTIEFLQTEMRALRTGRVAPSLVERVMVESYGTNTELLQLAAITTPEPQTISIKPWDKTILKDIAKAIEISDINVNPVVDSDIIRLNFPPLTEESRKELVKVLNKKLLMAIAVIVFTSTLAVSYLIDFFELDLKTLAGHCVAFLIAIFIVALNAWAVVTNFD